MFTYKSCPGTCGLTLVPDLATDLGTTSDNGLTWTFHIQSDVKYENGQTVTAADVKYAIERTYDRSVMANGPKRYQARPTDPTYPGPYKDKAGNLTAIRRPEPDYAGIPPEGPVRRPPLRSRVPGVGAGAEECGYGS